MRLQEGRRKKFPVSTERKAPIGHTIASAQGLSSDKELPVSAGFVQLDEPAVQVSTGDAHTCALLKSGRVSCWGRNRYGQLGYGNTVAIGDDELAGSAGFVDVGAKVVAIAAGGEHTCALTEAGAVRCWGVGVNGQLGYGNTKAIGDDELPSAAGDVPLSGKATAIAAGRDHTCAVLETGALRCWGRGT